MVKRTLALIGMCGLLLLTACNVDADIPEMKNSSDLGGEGNSTNGTIRWYQPPTFVVDCEREMKITGDRWMGFTACYRCINTNESIIDAVPAGDWICPV